jgi:hypothetical protein
VNGGVFGPDGDDFFFFKVHGVHGAFGDDLIFPEGSAGTQQFVHEGGLSVVNVGDDGDIADAGIHDWTEGGESARAAGKKRESAKSRSARGGTCSTAFPFGKRPSGMWRNWKGSRGSRIDGNKAEKMLLP